MRIFISAGEPSGDLHAANLIHALRERCPRPSSSASAAPRWREAGATLLYPLVNLAVMWFLNVLLNILTFIRLIFRADRYFRDEQPDAVILIDYPGLALVDRQAGQGAGRSRSSTTSRRRSGPGPAGG